MGDKYLCGDLAIVDVGRHVLGLFVVLIHISVGSAHFFIAYQVVETVINFEGKGREPHVGPFVISNLSIYQYYTVLSQQV